MIVGMPRESRDCPGSSGASYIDELEYEGWVYVEHGKYAGMYIRNDFYIFET